MKRVEIVAAAKLLGVKASGKNEEILAAIQVKLDSFKSEPKPLQRGVQLATKDAKPKDGRRGVHPITGEVIHKQ